MSDTKDLTSRHIPGIRWRDVVTYTLAIGFGVGVWVDLKKQSVSNYELMMEIKEEHKQEKVVNDARMDAIELSVRETKIRMDYTEKRMDYFEKFIDGYNKPAK